MTEKKKRGLYMIGVVARLAGVHPQTLRMYERKKLISPSRSEGSTRLYSDEDIETLKYIQGLTRDYGINLAGVRMIMDLRRELKRMQRFIEEMEKHTKELEEEMKREIERVHRIYRREIIPVSRGQIMKR
ncbi:MAG: MerR family transcriptional regulator [Actinomycetota bacterium]|nr:MerR family transcriptional regulator [Actinomycetota bacterium]